MLSAVKKEGDIVKCKKENKVLKSTVPRFRLKIIVSDNTDDATFVLFEKEVQKMLNKSASELLDIQEMKGDKYGFPEAFTQLLGKKLLFKVDIPSKHTSGTNRNFTVINSTDDQKLIDKWMGST
ncbi:uncharacterized protein LOC125494175 [Beta vulgaris subsp. vulgaris]|uniref:uncharacterized protein LOC125494175 n=1 Tax=Beta vulgaris subsp. vulgaris TaxID=3555 RepID=UPI0025479DE3|nr:uncharacterized protein LOC125494175 [Beta vulgaris subsp. vulgaris]